MARSPADRKAGKLVPLYSATCITESPEGLIIVRRLKPQCAMQLVAMGAAYFTYTQGQITGLRMKAIVAGESTSPTSLSAYSAQALAGVGLKKPHERCGKHLRRREEAEAAKVLIWPAIGDTKAVRVRPNVSNDELRRAEEYLLGKKRA